MTVPRPEVTFAAGERQDRHHAGDATAPRDAEDVLAHVGMERRVAQRREEAEARALDAVAEEPVAHGAPRFQLQHE